MSLANRLASRISADLTLASGGAVDAFATLLTENAVAVYSDRNVVPGFSGAIWLVRRSTDNAEAEFTATEFADGTLLAWAGAGSAYIKTWYDQLGSKHVTQTDPSKQPRIVNAGVIEPGVTFLGAQHLASATFTPIAQPGVIALNFSRAATATDAVVFGGSPSARWQMTSYDNTDIMGGYSGAAWPTFRQVIPHDNIIHVAKIDGINSRNYQSNKWAAKANVTVGTHSLDQIQIGSYQGTSNFFNGVMKEAIVLYMDAAHNDT